MEDSTFSSRLRFEKLFLKNDSLRSFSPIDRLLAVFSGLSFLQLPNIPKIQTQMICAHAHSCKLSSRLLCFLRDLNNTQAQWRVFPVKRRSGVLCCMIKVRHLYLYCVSAAVFLLCILTSETQKEDPRGCFGKVCQLWHKMSCCNSSNFPHRWELAALSLRRRDNR